ncbi:anti-sigma factor [Streptomyces sp. PT12]|uniref:anti-sigma factor family protein n=1 Tax=Streptomyces sp. PT12 TaxID=1510197 RepID=UPI000DE31E59|nr:zf-HC2 domain-containing protein [Streptomyces sp. PT12]RBM05567.1 hypothetical protein DEH69_27650 [Streptomyces sp. PT12]
MRENHPKAAEIAALDVDLLPPAEAAALREHLAGCVSCAAIQADLAALSDELARVPDPGPLPDDIAARIDAALAVEAAASTVSRETATGLPEDNSSRATPSSTAASSDEGAVRRPAPGPRWVRSLRLGLAAVGAMVVLGLGAVTLSSLGGEGDQDLAESAGSEEARDNGSAEAATEEPVATQVQELLDEVESVDPLITEDSSGSGSGESVESEGTDEDAAAPESTDTPEGAEPEAGGSDVEPDVEPVDEVPACVEAAIGRGEDPLAAGEEDYEGIDAYLVVFQHEVDPDQVDAYMVAASCATASPSATGEVLLQESYPRG